MKERLTDWLQLKEKFYEFQISPLVLNNIGLVCFILGIIIMVTLLIVLISHVLSSFN